MTHLSHGIWRSLRKLIPLVFVYFALSAHSLAQTSLITFDDVKEISPRALDEFAQAIADAETDFADAGITTRLRMAHFIAQVLTETGGLDRLDENMGYSFKSLMRVFSRKTVAEAMARSIAGNPQAVANWVYGDRLGNRGRTTEDGWTYRGSGFIQLTGRQNFRERGNDIGFPLEDSPELARQAREGLLAALAYWKTQNINAAADDNDLLRVRTLVNGPAARGVDQSKIWFSRAWNRVFREKMPDILQGTQTATPNLQFDEQVAFDGILKESGLLSHDFDTAADKDKDKLRTDAIKEFQQEVGLAETGKLDAATEDELHDPREWRHRDQAPTSVRAEAELEKTISFPLALPAFTGDPLVVP